jgi:Raf kinase inhibitor-like YbhB/YbcL family protein
MFILASPAFSDGGVIPPQYTADGEGISPELAWNLPSPEAKSFALIMHDPDAPKGDVTHWLLWNIPASELSLAEGTGQTSAGALGVNEHQDVAYLPPTPPRGHGPHRYIFELYALAVQKLDLARGADRAAVESAIGPHILDRTQLTGLYARAPARSGAGAPPDQWRETCGPDQRPASFAFRSASGTKFA